MLSIRPALSSFLDAIRGHERVADPKLNPKLNRLQQPVPKVPKLYRHFDGFESADARNTRSFTAPPKNGATTATSFLKGDGFDSPQKKPVELKPKPPPSFKPAIPVFRFR